MSAFWPHDFKSGNWLWLLLGVALLAGLYVLLQLQRKKYVTRFSNVELLGSIAPKRPDVAMSEPVLSVTTDR